MTATFGLVVVAAQTTSEEHLLQIADRALYKGKQLGRNKVVLADSTLY